MSLHVVDGMMLEGAFCVRCKANVLVDDSRACPDCGEQVHPLSLSRPDPPAGGTRATAGKPWSRDYPACRHCGTTERAHGGRGLCGRDYQRWMKGAIEGDF